MASFDLISDLHLDFWVKITWNPLLAASRLHGMLKAVVPEAPSDVLVIAGDLGHENRQNASFVRRLAQVYKYVVLVAGNHDYYVQTAAQRRKYRMRSARRVDELRKLLSPIPNVKLLDGDWVKLDGVTYGGCSMWYDFQYGIQILNGHYASLYEHWRKHSNDARFVLGPAGWLEEAVREEKRKLRRVVGHADVIVTHAAPDWSRVPEGRELDKSTSFYYFDGKPYMPELQGKLWCYGHVHKRDDYTACGCRFVNGSLGYPAELHGVPRAAVRVELGSNA
jgi:DNA repair exonuclease SbcCD nuclease subunit